MQTALQGIVVIGDQVVVVVVAAVVAGVAAAAVDFVVWPHQLDNQMN